MWDSDDFFEKNTEDCINKNEPGDVINDDLKAEKWGNKEPSKAGYRDLIKLVDTINDFNKKIIADNILKYIHCYDSDVEILTDDDNHHLLRLPKVKIIIDLFDVVESNLESLILKRTNSSDFTFLTIEEAYLTSKVYSKVYQYKTLKRGEIAKGKNIDFIGKNTVLGFNILNWILTKIFFGERNCAFNKSYSYMNGELQYSMLDYQVICYENRSEIEEFKEGTNDYLMEIRRTIDDQNLDNYFDGIIAIFSMSDSYQSLFFHGFYKIDKNSSRNKQHLVFGLYKDELLKIINI